MKYFVNILLLFLLLAGGCADHSENLSDPGFDYFPLQKGNFKIYSVNEIRFSEFSQPETLAYELKTEVVDSFPSGNKLIYVIHRSIRDTENDPWQFLDTGSAWSTEREIVQQEGSIPFVKLVFPVKKGNRWNGNTYNTLGADEYEVTAQQKEEIVDGTTFEQTVTVQQEDNDDIIVFQDRRTEKYARGIGLVFKEMTQLHYCTDDNCLGQQKIDEGVILKQILKAHGVQ